MLRILLGILLACFTTIALAKSPPLNEPILVSGIVLCDTLEQSVRVVDLSDKVNSAGKDFDKEASKILEAVNKQAGSKTACVAVPVVAVTLTEKVATKDNSIGLIEIYKLIVLGVGRDAEHIQPLKEPAEQFGSFLIHKNVAI